MRVLNRYIMSEVLKGAFVASLVLISLLNFFTFTDELGELGQGDYGFKQIFAYLALSTPHGFYDLLPSAALLGALVTLGGLANHRELMAMQAAGASKFQIVAAVVRAGLVLALISAAVAEYVSPPAERAAQLLKTTALKEQVASRTKYGFWVRDGNVYINIRQIKEQDHLGDISIYTLGENQLLQSATHAKRALYDGEKWKLKKLRTSRFADDVVTSEERDAADWSSILAPDLLNVFVVRPENLSGVELARYMDYLQENGQKSLMVDLAFWERVVNPFVTLVMLLVAVPFVLTIRRETSTGQRIVVGVTFGLGFYLFNRMFGHLGLIYELNPIIAASAPTALVFVGAVAAIARLR
ncbi:LPS export ABC transporter permease LptG [Methyloterricola oryzae]|uniref:LPS export ABC transporter permease LptG n=1 Tax=Methyloterricola oryzae TaxID=1495050 RepID=UPI000BEF2993|nr:LPS export ABC transporter permease LptG [Methyloterricola oryzae]